MPRYNVKLPDGRWQCFSSIVDDFVSEPMEEKEYEKWRKEEYGSGCIPLEETNKMDYADAFEIVKRNEILNEVFRPFSKELKELLNKYGIEYRGEERNSCLYCFFEKDGFQFDLEDLFNYM